MGVRLVNHSFRYGNGDGTGTHNHDELLHRDWVDQHPIYAITGLQEVLNTIENNITLTIDTLAQKEIELKEYTDTHIQQESDIINQKIDDTDAKIVEEYIDTETVKFKHDQENKSLKAEVVVYTDVEQTNSLERTPDGLYVPKLKPIDTDTISWSEISWGETIKEIFENGLKFSHNNTSQYNNLASLSEANAWYWDDNLNSIVQPLNTDTYNGYVSEHYYDNYKHCVTLMSNNSDDDANGIVLGYVFDENDRPHTLSAMIQRGGNIYLNYRFAIIYNFRLPGQEIVASYNLNNSASGWNSMARGITLYATKNENEIKVSATPWNYNNQITEIIEADDLPFEHTLEIDLDNYSWGHYFKDKVRYGYSNLSQANSYFTNIFFYSKLTKRTAELKARVRIKNDIDNAIEETEDGLFVSKKPLNLAQDHLNGIDYDHISNTYYVHKSHSFIQVSQQDHGLSIGDFIFYSTRIMGYQKALAKDDLEMNIVGMVNYIYDENNFEYVCSGFVETDLFDEDHKFVQGMPLYISDTDPGQVTQVQPDISKAVGYPIENKGLVISIERGIQYNQEKSIGDFMTSVNDYNIRSDGYIKVNAENEYKLNIMHKLVDKSNPDFISNYLIIDQENNTLKFKNIDALYIMNGITSNDGINLFIKAF